MLYPVTQPGAPPDRFVVRNRFTQLRRVEVPICGVGKLETQAADSVALAQVWAQRQEKAGVPA